MLIDEFHGRRAGDFTLQWHLTHACDLDCAHCYDRTKVSVLRREQAFAILDDMEAFCRAREVKPHVILSGGNPFFYPWFFDLYQSLAQRGIRVGILGNPVSRTQLDKLVSIARPAYFQVSLEGLEAHNDEIRGPGFFARVLEFLPMLREFKVRSIVMATLTDRNIEQIIPLGRLLEGKADRFNFNRLSQAGEGAALRAPSPQRYAQFLAEYMQAGDNNRRWGQKDNLFNIFNHHHGRKLSGGCTGYGCGAAFNFVAVLPAGEVHACRKFPSTIGHVSEQTFAEIWDGDEARRYRRGCSGCDGCSIRAKCGGCLAVTDGRGLDAFVDVDPDCFMLRARPVKGRGHLVRSSSHWLRTEP